ncbi:transglycosylase family protein [Actinacidiphila sp. SB3-2]
MSERARKSRHQTRRMARISLAITAGGAGIALPLLGAGSAHAADVSTWDKVAQCESGGDWSINTGNGYSGGVQFDQQTWSGHGGTQYAPSAGEATKEQQIKIAEKVLAEQGPSAWPNCGPKAGLSQGGPSPDLGGDSGSGSQQQSEQKQQAPKQEAPKQEAPKQESAPKPQSAPKQQDAPQNAGTTSYKVVSGDTLGKIADAKGVQGGWKKLYEDNRQTVGGNPNVIFPGQNLDLKGGSGSGSGDAGAKPQGSAKAAPSAADEAKKAEKSADQAEKKAEKKAADVKSVGGDYVKPVDAPTSTPYKASGGSWSSGSHTGVDFSAQSGTPVKAVTNGTVVKTGNGGAYGNEVVIKGEDGKYTQYGHLTSATVQAGQKVNAGDQIAISGNTGNTTGPHLHFEVRTGPEYGSDIDPVAYLQEHGLNV